MQTFHLYRNQHLKTLVQTYVDVSQVLSPLMNVLSTSREAHTLSTIQLVMEVSFLRKEYVRTEVLFGIGQPQIVSGGCFSFSSYTILGRR